MTPIGINLDFEDLANRALDAAGEALFGPPKLEKEHPPAGIAAKIQKAKEKAIQRHAIQRVLQHHRHLLKQLDAYRKQIGA